MDVVLYMLEKGEEGQSKVYKLPMFNIDDNLRELTTKWFNELKMKINSFALFVCESVCDKIFK